MSDYFKIPKKKAYWSLGGAAATGGLAAAGAKIGIAGAFGAVAGTLVLPAVVLGAAGLGAYALHKYRQDGGGPDAPDGPDGDSDPRVDLPNDDGSEGGAAIYPGLEMEADLER